MRPLVIGLVLGALLLVPFTPAHAIVCNNSTVLGTYIFTFSGVDAEGNTLSSLAVANLANGDANGNGAITGTLYLNERGVGLQTRGLVGNYQILTNCWITIRFQEQVGTTFRLNALTGFVTLSGGLITFASPFDGGVQLSGNAVFVPF